jgi:hypothetical protein
MSVIRFKSTDFASLRIKREDFTSMGKEYMKRDRDGAKITTTTTTTTTAVTPPRAPRAPITMFRPTTLTVSSSAVSSLLYNRLSGEQFCWKLRDYFEKRKPTFTMKTKMLFMPGGNVFEDFVLSEMQKALTEEKIITNIIQRQFNRDEIPRIYENDLLSRLNRQNYKYETRDGFTNQISDDLKMFGRRLVCRTDGLLPDYVVEAKVPFGSLYKKHKSGVIVKEDGTKEYDKTKEIFEIPIRYKLQLLIQMNCYKKKKAVFGQYYIFNNWKSFTDLLKRQYEKAMRGVSLMAGEVIYKPSLDKTVPILTILGRLADIIKEKIPTLGDVEKALLTSKQKTTRSKANIAHKQTAMEKIWEFISEYCDYRIQKPSVKTDKELKEKIEELERQKALDNTEALRERLSILNIQIQESYGARFKTAVEEVFRKNPQWLNNIIKRTTFLNLVNLTSTETTKDEENKDVLRHIPLTTAQKTKVLDALDYGGRKDIRRGVITFNGRILWDGDSRESPMPEKDILMSWIKDILKEFLPGIRRKDPVKWKAFEDEVTKNDNLDFSLYPTMNSYGQFKGYGEYNELVVLEMDMTKEYGRAMSALKEFLGHCDRTVKYRIPCKAKKKHPLTKEVIQEKMVGKIIGYREKFIEYLTRIPVKMVARREVQI